MIPEHTKAAKEVKAISPSQFTSDSTTVSRAKDDGLTSDPLSFVTSVQYTLNPVGSSAIRNNSADAGGSGTSDGWNIERKQQELKNEHLMNIYFSEGCSA